MLERRGYSRCPNDGALIARVDKTRLGPASFVRCYWCHWCEELFVYVGKSETDLRFVASFGYDPEKAGFWLWKAVGTEAEVEQVKSVVADLPFVPVLRNGPKSRG